MESKMKADEVKHQLQLRERNDMLRACRQHLLNRIEEVKAAERRIDATLEQVDKVMKENDELRRRVRVEEDRYHERRRDEVTSLENEVSRLASQLSEATERIAQYTSNIEQKDKLIRNVYWTMKMLLGGFVRSLGFRFSSFPCLTLVSALSTILQTE
jgi:peptidoglycan hydrolase CwlO-like protein